ncbi:helix-turn-helix transcriptional regulator [Natronoglycomyces albus]|uniref:AAA family ATPase n=1 Tax=Natronoglycomyces albus TaxID=2811108 RepID=A0A895XSZ8_9ACTN|nr:helix-turn-helix transcriptional regulator [Natronoglycomyces albus]QSB05390.1 AAA family ATPase [Natronoglycomyces albus]
MSHGHLGSHPPMTGLPESTVLSGPAQRGRTDAEPAGRSGSAAGSIAFVNGLHGRGSEFEALDALLQRARSGHSGSIVIRGEAGIGKSTLIDHVESAAGDFRVLRSLGVESEQQWAFSGLHMLLRPVRGSIDSLPAVQAAALNAAMGFSDVAGNDRLQVGVAVLYLLAELAENQPLLCIIDDAHWLDGETADALLFAARRFQVEPIVMIFAARDNYAPEFPAPGIDNLSLAPVDDTASRAILSEAAPTLTEMAVQQLLIESRGNPLALRELAAAHQAGSLDGSTYHSREYSTAARLYQAFNDRINCLPEATRTLLLVASAEMPDETAAVFHAAEKFGATVADLEPAERAGLLQLVDGQLIFGHPLIRATAYRSAPLHRRLRIHRSLAEAPRKNTSTCARVMHLASAANGADDDIADMLDELAVEGRRRGGHLTEARTYERAARLSVDPVKKARRLLAAAEAALLAGQMDRAIDLAEASEIALTDHADLARSATVRATVAVWKGDFASGQTLWIAAANHTVVSDPDTAGYPLFRSVEAAWMAGDYAVAACAAKYADDLNLRTSPWVRYLATATAGFSNRDGFTPSDAVVALRHLIDVHDENEDRLGLQERSMVIWWFLLCSDFERAHRHAVTLVEECRRTSGIGVLPRVLNMQARAEIGMGRLSDAELHVIEAQRLAEDLGQNQAFVQTANWALAYIAAVRGDEEACESHMGDRSDSSAQAWRLSFLALLDIGLGRFDMAQERLEELVATGVPLEIMLRVPDLIEVAARQGRTEDHREIFAWFRDYSYACQQPGAEAIVERCLALLAADDDAQAHFARAVELHRQGTDEAFERARTDLLYGEWLRRQRRPSQARSRLRAAAETFERMQAHPWSQRARSELRAAGDSSAQSRAGAVLQHSLTPQELQVVRLAAQGLTNRDIGGQLFLSPRTVGYHLYKAYPKLGVSSRAELPQLDLAG